MMKRKSGLIVEVVEQPGIGYHGQFFFDLTSVAQGFNPARSAALKGCATTDF